jgi:translation initiation factor 3 subunit B
VGATSRRRRALGRTACVLIIISVSHISGRSLFWGRQLENGYAIWDFRGQEAEKHLLDGFKQFLWRPRPPSLLTKEQKRLIRKNLREYSRAFDEEDAAEESNVSAELIALRKRLVDEWNAWRTRCMEEVADVRRAKGVTVDASAEEEEREEIELWVDEVTEQVEEIVEG